MKLSNLLVAIITVLSFSLSAKDIKLTETSNHLSITSKTLSEFTFVSHLSEINTLRVKTDMGEFVKLVVGGYGENAISGNAELPVLVDRDVCLYDSVVLMEYLDERFPHPPLLPVYPVSRAEIRLFIQRIQKDWCEMFDNLVSAKLSDSELKKTRQEFKSQIIALSPILKEKPFFMSEDFSLVDCCIAPILWRLPLIGIELQKDAKTKPIYAYMQRIFTKPCFINSLSELEREIRS